MLLRRDGRELLLRPLVGYSDLTLDPIREMLLNPATVLGVGDGGAHVTVICESDCTLLLLSQRHFMAVLDDVPSMAHKLLASLAGRIRDLDRQYYG